MIPYLFLWSSPSDNGVDVSAVISPYHDSFSPYTAVLRVSRETKIIINCMSSDMALNDLFSTQSQSI